MAELVGEATLLSLFIILSRLDGENNPPNIESGLLISTNLSLALCFISNYWHTRGQAIS